jgi:hypothetical protein
MHRFGQPLGALLLVCGALLVPSTVLARRGSDEPAAAERLQTEHARLRAELDRVNAEIAVLKRSERNVRNEYRLREKMADAEALARRLTEAESRLRGFSPPAPAPALTLAPPPVVSPHDDAVELEAKADLLSDQSRRLVSEAEALARVAAEIRNRQALRRRAESWERNPFAGFEGSKRSVVVQSQQRAATNSAEAAPQLSADSASKGAAPTSSGADVTRSAPGAAGGGSGTFASPATGAIVPPKSSSDTVATPPVTASPAPSSTRLTPTPLPPALAPKVSLQSRTLLDPASLAVIRNSLSQAGSLSDPEAVDAAVAALRQRARALEEQARALRARVRQ